MERELESRHIILASLLSEEDAKSLASLKDHALAMETARCKLRQKSKFVRLLSKYRSVTHSSDVQDRWVVNLSSNPLTEFETEVLRKGLNFAPSPQAFLYHESSLLWREDFP